jgi:hypothetical protein
MAGWIALEGLKDGAVAGSYFAEAQRFATAPSSQARVAYWQARALVAAKLPPDEALTRAAVHGLTYYGQLALARLGRGKMAMRQPVGVGMRSRTACSSFSGLNPSSVYASSRQGPFASASSRHLRSKAVMFSSTSMGISSVVKNHR